jgi:hypothetical protein
VKTNRYLGLLVPLLPGRKSLALSVSVMNISRTTDPAPRQAFCVLSIKDGWWHAKAPRARAGMRIIVNGRRCRDAYLLPGDIITLLGEDYRISYKAPKSKPPCEPTPFFCYGSEVAYIGAPSEIVERVRSRLTERQRAERRQQDSQKQSQLPSMRSA